MVPLMAQSRFSLKGISKDTVEVRPALARWRHRLGGPRGLLGRCRCAMVRHWKKATPSVILMQYDNAKIRC